MRLWFLAFAFLLTFATSQPVAAQAPQPILAPAPPVPMQYSTSPDMAARQAYLQLAQQRRDIGLGGPIALTIAGGVIAANGVLFLMMGFVASESAFTDDASTTYYTIGGIALGLGAILGIIGGIDLSDRIAERRRIKDQMDDLQVRYGIVAFDPRTRFASRPATLSLQF